MAFMQPFSQFVACLISAEIYVQDGDVGQSFPHRIPCVLQVLVRRDLTSERLQKFDRAEIDQGFIFQKEDVDILKDAFTYHKSPWLNTTGPWAEYSSALQRWESRLWRVKKQVNDETQCKTGDEEVAKDAEAIRRFEC